ncbi:MAG: hypothetical protein V2J07_09280 [Anaerolineae bacterium]|jgi:hypothetical protein|nr:hypothetical protein [Anaerolineae bacterium]
MTNEKRPNPKYKGQTKYVNNDEGFAVWLPSDWHKFEMKEGHIGWVFSPYANDFNTSFTVQKNKLDYKVTPEDIEILMEGFLEGINSLADVEILETKSDSGKKAVILEAKFTFTEGGETRKRWVKSMYWGEANLVMIAQGKTVEDYEYWLPMLYNSMYDYELGVG